MLEISKIHQGKQVRAGMNEQTISEYSEHLSNGGEFPPIVVFFDSRDYWLADGWHRFLAHKRIGCLEIAEDVRIGTERDALRYALSANSGHGLPRTNQDKRNAVALALADAEWSTFSSREIAALCAVSPNLVAEMKRGKTAEEKTENNKKLSSGDKVKVNSTVTNKNTQELKREENIPEEESYDPEDDELSEAHSTVIHLSEENQRLKDMIAIGNLPEPEQTAGEIIIELRAQVKTLEATLSAVISSRDSLQSENTQLKQQCAMQRKEIKKLGGK